MQVHGNDDGWGADASAGAYQANVETVRHGSVGAAMRVLCHVASVNPDRVAECPPDDRQATVRTALALIFSFLFTTTAVSGALAIAFGLSGAAITTVVPLAALMASAIILVDHAIIQSHWFQTGSDHANARGFHPDGAPFAGRIRRLGLGLVRLLLSAVLAYSVAGFVELLIFSSDIARQLAETQRAANADVFSRATQRVDGEIALLDANLAVLDRRQAAAVLRYDEAVREATTIRGAEKAANEARIARLLNERDQQLADADRHDKEAIAEEFGISDAAHQRNPGRRRLYDAARAFEARALARTRDLQAEIDRLSLANTEADQTPGIATARRETERLAEQKLPLTADRNRLVAARDAAILTTARADPGYVPVKDGLILRLSALGELHRDPAAQRQALGIKALIMLIEMAGLLVKLLLVSPSLYAVRTAVAFEAAAAAALARSEQAITATAKAATEAREAREVLRDDSDRRRSSRRHAAYARSAFGDALT